jgi:hypothetical protein
MNPGKRYRMLAPLLCLLSMTAALKAQNSNGVTNEWRITAFPHYPITEKVSGFGYLGWVKNPGSAYSLWYLGTPGFIYMAKPRLQVWTGLLDIYTNNYTNENGKQDTLELRPFIGGKFFLPNKRKWNIYNFTRLEFRQTYHHDTHEWTTSSACAPALASRRHSLLGKMRGRRRRFTGLPMWNLVPLRQGRSRSDARTGWSWLYCGAANPRGTALLRQLGSGIAIERSGVYAEHYPTQCQGGAQACSPEPHLEPRRENRLKFLPFLLAGKFLFNL